MIIYRLFGFFALVLLCAGLPCSGQVLYLEETESGENEVEVAVGDIIEVEVHADLGRFSASGIAFFIAMPCSPFQVVDLGRDEEIRPFSSGALFDGSIEAGNTLVYGDTSPDMPNDQQLLSYAAIVGPGARRGRSGSGAVARFTLLCVEPVQDARITIRSTPIHETRLVLEDGFTERLFSAIQGLEITVAKATAVGDETWGSIKAEFVP
jgi:hypothetical protein